MKIVVAVKQVRVLADEAEFTADGRDVDPACLDRALNEWDACAVEEAVRARELLGGGEVVVITAGDGKAEAVLRRGLAMGADRATRVEGQAVDPVGVARLLTGAVAAESPDIVLCGAQSSDSVQGATGAALAGLLGLSCAAVVTKIELDGNRGAVVYRELEGGVIDVVELDLPAVVTVQTGINEPRYATLRAIKQAEQVEIAVVAGGDSQEDGYAVRRMFVPERGERATMLDGSPAEIARQIVEIVKDRLA